MASLRADPSVVVTCHMIALPDALLVMMENTCPLRIIATTHHQFDARLQPDVLTSAGEEVSGVVNTRGATRFRPVNIRCSPTGKPPRSESNITPRHNAALTLVRSA